VALVTDLETGNQRLVNAEDSEALGQFHPQMRASIEAGLATDRSVLLDAEGNRLFVHVFCPAPRLAIVGAVHIAEGLIPLAVMLGYAVTVIDPRQAFARRSCFDHVRIISNWPDQALRELAPDARTAIVTLSHDPKLDDPALEAALASPAFYIGALGSQRTQAARLERLRARGIDEDDLRRIRGPAGLAIGAVTAAEIALAIAAEMTLVRRMGRPAAMARP
jgi:xanthine dehydrogenase accessory factor